MNSGFIPVIGLSLVEGDQRYLLLDGSNAMSGNLNRTVGGFQVGLDLASAGINANRVLTVDTNNADRTVSLSGNLTVELNSLINQDLTTDSATARLQTLTLGLNGAGGYVGTLTVADGLNPGSSVSVVHADIDNWNTAYGWGNHAGLYLPIGGGTVTGATTIQGALTLGKNGAGGVAGSLVMLDGLNPGSTYTLSYAELGYIDGLNQYLSTTSTPTFARGAYGTTVHATDILTVLSADTVASGNVLNISHSGNVTGSHTGIKYVGTSVCSIEQIGQSISLSGLSAKNTCLILSASGSATANLALGVTAGTVSIGGPAYSAIKLVDILQTSTTANSVGVNILHNGLVAGGASTVYGQRISVTGANGTNIGLDFSGGVTGATTNYWIYASSANFWQSVGVLNIGGGTTSAMTDLLINPAIKVSGNLFDFQVGGISKCRLEYSGAFYGVTLVGGTVKCSNIFHTSGNNCTLSIADTRTFDLADKIAINLVNTTITNSSGGFAAVRICPTYNQTLTAAATDFLINRTETAVGSGAQLFLDLQTSAGGSKFKIDNTGLIYQRDGATYFGILDFTSSTALGANRALTVDLKNLNQTLGFGINNALVHKTLTPVGSGAGSTAGTTGEVVWDGSFLYVCSVGGGIGASTWLRATLAAY